MLQEYLECRFADLDSCRDAGGASAKRIGKQMFFYRVCPHISLCKGKGNQGCARGTLGAIISSSVQYSGQRI